MLVLLFHVDDNTYGIDLGRIIEIVPFVELKSLPMATPLIAGVFDYRGSIVPVVDVTKIISGSNSMPLLSTRIIIVSAKNENAGRAFGILAERATETILCNESDFQSINIGNAEQNNFNSAALLVGHRVENTDKNNSAEFYLESKSHTAINPLSYGIENRNLHFIKGIMLNSSGMIYLIDCDKLITGSIFESLGGVNFLPSQMGLIKEIG